MKEETVLGVFTGKAREVFAREKTWQTGIFKEPVEGRVRIHFGGVGTDVIANTDVHGGPSRAVYCYSQKAYAPWESVLSKDVFKPGLFGENILLTELQEDKIHIGDIFSIGSAQIQATVPRHPCFLFQHKAQYADAIKKFIELARPGIYFKVIKEGEVQVGDSFSLVQKSDLPFTLAEFFKEYAAKTVTWEKLDEYRKISIIPELYITRFEAALKAKEQ